MKSIVAGHVAQSTTEFIELALGTPPQLWLGVEGETQEERAAREDAARDILTEYPGLPDEVTRLAAELFEARPQLATVIPLRRTGRGPAPTRQALIRAQRVRRSAA